jgi:sterol desaturase/sphingolipid hydroxylase (fatty acid hydroxylase superfamily)
MADQLIELTRFCVSKALELWLSPVTVVSVAGLLFAFLVTVVMQRWSTLQWREALRAQLLTDAAYTFFYISGIFYALIAAPVYAIASAGLDRFAPFLRLNLGAGLHPVVHFIVLTLSLDFVSYWTHRLEHRSPLLWEFHKVHHSQTVLTPLTNFRFHVVDILLRSTLMLIPMMILGTQTNVWLAVIFFELALDGMAHSNLPWTYGALGWIFVNPQSHRLHHSVDERHYDRNFGQQYNLWDVLFRTRYTGAREVPTEYGVPGEHMSASPVTQQFVPFIAIAKRLIARRAKPAAGAQAPAQ